MSDKKNRRDFRDRNLLYRKTVPKIRPTRGFERGRWMRGSTLLLCIFQHGRSEATLSLPTLVGSHMVLQRAPKHARIWGFAAPYATVSIALNGDDPCATSVVGGTGRWEVMLPPRNASVDHVIEISDGATTITLEDVAFGDVFACAGQSNSDNAQNRTLWPPIRYRMTPAHAVCTQR